MALFPATDTFARRHIGPSPEDAAAMLDILGVPSIDALTDQVVPPSIRLARPLALPAARGEAEVLADLSAMAAENEIWRSYIGMGYSDTVTPPVILRNILENPGWYTAYTPYQAEISQGRLEMILNYQTMIRDLTGMDLANGSLLDEGTAAAEAMAMAHRLQKGNANTFLVHDGVHPQTIAVLRTRAEPLGLDVQVASAADMAFEPGKVFGVLLQYPATDGTVTAFGAIADAAHAAKAIVVVASDLLALTLLTPPGEWGADVVIGNSQRFGVPFGFGGPHAAFMATREAYVRSMPGRIIGVSRDVEGNLALRMALGTREQHIRREKATSNICTAQVLLAVTAAAYAIYHGPIGLRAIASRVHAMASTLAAGLRSAGFEVASPFFDTLRVSVGARRAEIVAAAAARRINLRTLDADTLCVALDERVGDADLADLFVCFGVRGELSSFVQASSLPETLARTSPFLTDRVFNSHHSETQLLRYLHRLEVKDFALNAGMIPLGSCTMKLNATTEMIPVTMPGFGRIQPNAGSQGEYAGLLAIREYHKSRGDTHRDICLIPKSAHGTNPASAVMAGMKVVVVECDDNGNVDVPDLLAKADKHAANLAALMVTYPSTHGVFETAIRQICQIIHDRGGQVYMDGANMNAQVGLCSPGGIGADVCHLNLHKTFCIPHGGGGPGMGPIGVGAHLAPFLPGHPVTDIGRSVTGPVSAAPWGSSSILVISWAYIAMMGPDGLADATKNAILTANYVAKRLEGAYETLYRGENGLVAHECILDLRPLKPATQVEAEDVAKRLMDYGFHAPTLSFPVAGTLMVEPTESEDKGELDRFIDAMLAIRDEIRAIEAGALPKDDNPLKGAPHTAACVTRAEWSHAYPREQAAFPTAFTRAHKYWPTVRRIDNVYGDRNLVCACVPIDAYV
jgi:glycine dehydrogenase